MSEFDLIGYARQHRYRLRNMNDGRPVPPTRKQARSRVGIFGGNEDRDMAIVCRHGYVSMEGDRLGWVVLCGTAKMMLSRLRQICWLPGVVVRQEGYSEAAGTIPPECIDSILIVLVPFKRQPPRPGRTAEEMRTIVDTRRIAPGGAG